MKLAVQSILGLLACLCLQSAWGAEALTGNYEECIDEPVFEGKVCTLQANRDAKVGVILIHGLGGSIDDWKNTIPALAKNFHVVAFDLPGFGKSDKGSQEYSPTRYARLAHFLSDRYFPHKNYHIVGHSMGGAIALRFAAQRPMRFQRLVLIDSAGILHPQVLTKFQAGSVVQSTSGMQQMRGYAETVSGAVLEQVDRLPISPIDVAKSDLGREHVLQGGPEKIAALELVGENFSYAIATVTEPTLILWGDQDPIVPQRTGRVLAARMPQARLEIIPDSGHVPMQDQTEQTSALILRHLLASARDLVRQYPHAPRLPPFTSERVGTCLQGSNTEFEGDYRSIELRDCSNITIRNARIGQLSVINSQVTIFDTDILGSEEGLLADDSDITVTNGDISGAIAIRANASRLDLAGVHLNGSRDAVKAVDSKIVFSVSRVHSPHMDGAMHAYRKMDDGVF